VGLYSCTCQVCNQTFVISRRHKKAFYCSDACNHKAFRARKKSVRAEEARQIDARSWDIYQFVVRSRPDLEAELSAYFVAWKKAAFCEMLGLLAKLLRYEDMGAAADDVPAPGA